MFSIRSSRIVDHLPVRARIGEFQGVDRSITKNETFMITFVKGLVFGRIRFERDSLRTRPQRKNGFFDFASVAEKSFEIGLFSLPLQRLCHVNA
jgi:hypothetical protein